MSVKMIGLLLVVAANVASVAAQTVYTVSGRPPANAKKPFREGFISYSIEFASFPDFAGNKSAPNNFSYTLLSNLGDIVGSKPVIRVGGNTQDYALWNSSLEVGLRGSVNTSRSPDYPTTVHIGPAFFESYSTWPGVRFTHGFNLGGNNRPQEQWETLLATVPLVCKALGTDKLDHWQYGNEADLYSTSAQGPVRPPNWNETAYVQQWINGTRMIKQLIEQNCPEVLEKGRYTYLAPSFAGTGNHLRAPKAWAAGLDADKNIGIFNSHKYVLNCPFTFDTIG
jgi:hypothetical protein